MENLDWSLEEIKAKHKWIKFETNRNGTRWYCTINVDMGPHSNYREYCEWDASPTEALKKAWAKANERPSTVQSLARMGSTQPY